MFMLINFINVLVFVVLLASVIVMAIVVWDVQDPVRVAVNKSWKMVEKNLGDVFCRQHGGAACAEPNLLNSTACTLSCKEEAIVKINSNQRLIECVFPLPPHPAPFACMQHTTAYLIIL